MNASALKIYDKAPPAGKVMLIAGIALLIFFAIRFIGKLLAPKTSTQSAIDTAKDELKQLTESQAGPNYSPAQFSTWADGLQEAMKGQGTDEDAIAGIFKYLRNKADVLSLIKAFGTREYTDDKFMMFNVKQMNLNEWLNAELSDAAKADYINSVLKKNNIDYTF